MALTYHAQKERDEQVLKMIEDGLSVNAIAQKLEISPKAVRKFLRVRGWKTKYMEK